MKKILILKTFPLSLKNWNEVGIITRELKLYNRILDLYDNFSFSLVSYGNKEDLELINHIGNVKLLLPFKRFNNLNSYKKFILSFFIPLILKKDFQNTNFIQTNQFRGSWVAIIAKVLFKKKIILRIGFEYYDFQKKLKKNIIYLILLKYLSKIVYNFSDNIIVTTEDIKIFIIQTFGINEKKITIIPNYIDTDLFKKINVTSKNNLLFIGRLNEQKNLFNVFKALKGLNAELDLIGHGERKQYLKLSTDLKIKVNFIDNIKNDQLTKIYNSCKIFLLCSNFEGNPKTLLEAMACECAILCTNVDGIRNLVNSNNAMIVNQDSSSIKEGLEKLLSDDKLRIHLSSNTRKEILARNSINVILKKLLNFYEMLNIND